jgi:DNA-binding transcriptional ArsR family regulator
VEQKAIMHDEGKQSNPSGSALKRALSHPRRLEILDCLMQKKGVGTDEADLAEALDLSAPRVRYHLSVLQSADLISLVSDQEQDRYIAAASASL